MDHVIGYQPQAAHGYKPRRRTKVFVCDDLPELAPEEGFEPIQVEVVTGLTWGEREDIKRQPRQRYDERFALIAPYVVAWNVMAEDAETGELKPVPPPAEGGPDVFRLIDPLLFDWIDMRVLFGHTTLLDPKPLTASDDTPASEPATNSTRESDSTTIPTTGTTANSVTTIKMRDQTVTKGA